MLYVDPICVLQDAWRDCLAADRIDELTRLAEVVARKAHPRQRDFVRDPGKRVAALVGRGGGKTTGAMFRLVRKMLLQERAQCLYLARSREQAEKLLWGPLKEFCARLGIDAKFAEDKLMCTFRHNLATVTLAGADDKASIERYRGIPHDEVVIDECASFPPKLLDNLINRVIIPRLGDRDGSLVLIGTPGHDLRGQFYEVTRPGAEESRPWSLHGDADFADWSGWSFHSWTLLDAANANVQAAQNLWRAALVEKRNKGWSDDHPLWRREYLGQWSRDDTETIYHYRPHDDEGHEWNRWNPEKTAFGFAKLPDGHSDWIYTYGIDIGFSDPTAIQVFAYSASDAASTLYQVYELEKRRLNVRDIASILIGPDLNVEQPSGLFGETDWPTAIHGDIAGGGGEGILKELAEVYGIRVTPGARRWGDKRAAIEMFNGDLVDGRIKVLEGSKLEEQLSQLQWAVKEDGSLREDHSARNDCCDAALLARAGAKHLLAAEPPAARPFFKPRAPDPDTEAPTHEPSSYDEFGGLFSDDDNHYYP